MKVVLTDGTELSCRNFKAIESGVLLTRDKKRKKVVGFVPTHQLRYVVRDDVEPVSPADVDAETTDEPSGELSIRPSSSGPVESAVRDETGAVTGDPASGSDLRRLGGLGSTYAERLQSAGFERLSDLSVADPVVVAEAAAVAPGRGRRWVNAAIRATGDERGPRDGEAVTADDGAGGTDGEASDDRASGDRERSGDDANEHRTAEADEVADGTENPEDDA